MTTLYRKIPCSERLPEKDGEYSTNIGELTFVKEKKAFFYDLNAYPAKVTYWFDPIQPPTDEEIEKIISELQKHFRFGFDIDSWKSGFKSCLELLTGGKKY